MEIDHVVLWVESPKRALAFYVEVLGLAPERAEDYAAGEAGFPSVRLNETTILDLMARDQVAAVRTFTSGGADGGGGADSGSGGGGDGDDASDGTSGGTPINHLCLAMTAADYATLAARLERAGVRLVSAGERPFGARGRAREAAYFRDPDGNVIEIRNYEGEGAEAK